jgi:hypothetical protein
MYFFDLSKPYNFKIIYLCKFHKKKALPQYTNTDVSYNSKPINNTKKCIHRQTIIEWKHVI